MQRSTDDARRQGDVISSLVRSRRNINYADPRFIGARSPRSEGTQCSGERRDSASPSLLGIPRIMQSRANDQGQRPFHGSPAWQFRWTPQAAKWPTKVQILSAKRMMKLSRFGILTLDSVSAFIVSVSPIKLFFESMKAVSAYTSASESDLGCCHGIARRMKSKRVVA